MKCAVHTTIIIMCLLSLEECSQESCTQQHNEGGGDDDTWSCIASLLILNERGCYCCSGKADLNREGGIDNCTTISAGCGIVDCFSEFSAAVVAEVSITPLVLGYHLNLYVGLLEGEGRKRKREREREKKKRGGIFNAMLMHLP